MIVNHEGGETELMEAMKLADEDRLLEEAVQKGQATGPADAGEVISVEMGTAFYEAPGGLGHDMIIVRNAEPSGEEEGYMGPVEQGSLPHPARLHSQ